MRPATKYAYILGTNDEGKPTVVGPFPDKDEARAGSGDLQGKRLFMLTTRNHARATQTIKAQVLGKSGKNHLALQRHRHDKREMQSAESRSRNRSRDEDEQSSDRGVIDDLDFDSGVEF